jgi:predicted transcriptional regulator
MTIKEIAALVQATVLCGDAQLDSEQTFAFASDLMSDVLTIKADNFMLITGLANIQSIRTAEMSDVKCILLVRGKVATEDMIELAQENGIVLLSTAYSMFKTSGILHSAGVKPVY